jgi:putative redox protein
MPIETPDSRVEAIIDSRFKVTSVARGHVTISDEPEELGGDDSAMDPTELLLSALASCKLATIRLVAKRKGWNTDGLQIQLSLFKEPVEGGTEKTTIRQTISFPDHLTEEQRGKLTAISHKCPVSRIVTGEIHFTDY